MLRQHCQNRNRYPIIINNQECTVIKNKKGLFSPARRLITTTLSKKFLRSNNKNNNQSPKQEHHHVNTSIISRDEKMKTSMIDANNVIPLEQSKGTRSTVVMSSSSSPLTVVAAEAFPSSQPLLIESNSSSIYNLSSMRIKGAASTKQPPLSVFPQVLPSPLVVSKEGSIIINIGSSIGNALKEQTSDGVMIWNSNKGNDNIGSFHRYIENGIMTPSHSNSNNDNIIFLSYGVGCIVMSKEVVWYYNKNNNCNYMILQDDDDDCSNVAIMKLIKDDAIDYLKNYFTNDIKNPYRNDINKCIDIMKDHKHLYLVFPAIVAAGNDDDKVNNNNTKRDNNDNDENEQHCHSLYCKVIKEQWGNIVDAVNEMKDFIKEKIIDSLADEEYSSKPSNIEEKEVQLEETSVVVGWTYDKEYHPSRQQNEVDVQVNNAVKEIPVVGWTSSSYADEKYYPRNTEPDSLISLLFASHKN